MPHDADRIPFPRRSGGGGKKGGGSGKKPGGSIGGMVILVSGIALTFLGTPVAYFVWHAVS